MAFQGVEDFEMEFIGDFFDGLERIRGKDNAFLIQCSAHPKVHEVTERHWAEVFVVDTFIYPTKALAVLSRCASRDPLCGARPRARCRRAKVAGQRHSDNHARRSDRLK